ncbi:hypothetical protein RIF29_15896 [Crotalaria pallida]|uniref:RNase H type-1 domain-containing protein n=1 Tax=Crotalaria pallida TaxID=3830 RepID=A0AAN9FE32_CROPI
MPTTVPTRSASTNVSTTHPGAVLVYVNAATRSRVGTGAGMLVLSQDDSFLAAATAVLQEAMEPSIAEGLSLRWALEVLIYLGITHACIRSNRLSTGVKPYS